jgi:tetratricopeptide (TPR) repeat protein
LLEGVLDQLALIADLLGEGPVALIAALGLAGSVGGLAAVARVRRQVLNADANLERQIARLIERSDYAAAGELRLRQGQYDRALGLFLQSGNGQRAAECYLALKQPRRAAQVFAEMERWSEAAHHFQAACAWRDAADCLLQVGQEREAADLYERAGEFARAANLLRSLGEAEDAARLFERVGLFAEAATSLLQARGKSAAALRRAGDLFERAGELRRSAECYAGAGDWPRAGELLEEARAFSLAGQAFERAGQWDRAGGAYEQAGALHEARANYERAGDSTRAANVAVRLGSLLDAARDFYRVGAYERAIETLQSIPNDSPLTSEAKLLLGRIFLEKGLIQRALENLKAAEASCRDGTSNTEIVCLLAEAYERGGDVAQASDLLRDVLTENPECKEAQERLDEITRKTGGEPSRGAYPIRDDRYDFQGEIGRGGMGVVYLAVDQELGRPVAIKFLPEALATKPAALELFRAEARAAAAMNHPNLVQVYDVGVIGGRPCIVMEYVPGRTVRDLMRQPDTRARKPLTPRRVAEIGREVARALHYAHEQNVIHRDVKPGNILVSETGQVKLMDFGISKMLEGDTDGETQGRGTPQYMPPEQILGRGIDGRTDLYALGISAFEMLTGVRPFTGDNVVDQQLNDPLPDLRQSNPNVPIELVRIVQRSCQKLPGDRYGSGNEMSQAFAHFLAGESIDEGGDPAPATADQL